MLPGDVNTWGIRVVGDPPDLPRKSLALLHLQIRGDRAARRETGGDTLTGLAALLAKPHGLLPLCAFALRKRRRRRYYGT